MSRRGPYGRPKQGSNTAAFRRVWRMIRESGRIDADQAMREGASSVTSSSLSGAHPQRDREGDS